MEERAKILLVDDEPDHRLLLASSLKDILPEATLWEAGGVEEALRVLSAQRLDAVLCDYWLGESTGLDLLRAAREKGLDAAFLLVTNHGSEEVARQAFLEGVADYLTKDLAFRNPEDLSRKLRQALEKRRLTEEREQAETLLESFLENNPFAILICDEQGRVLRWNRTLTRMERHPEDLDRLREAYSPLEDPQLRRQGVAQLLDRAVGGQWVQIPPFLWDPEQSGFKGPPRILRGVAFPIGQGTPHLCVMFQDVTAEETARRERDEYAAVLASLLNASGAAIFFVDTQLNVRFANRYVEEFFGVDPSAYVGRAKLDLAQVVSRATAAPEEFLARLAYLYENLEEESEEVIEVISPRARHLRRYSGPVRGSDGAVLGRIEVYLDETEAVERQRLLEKQNRELDAFASRLAHDLKTPLVSLKGFADLLDRHYGASLDARGHMYLDKVRSSAALLGEMVDGLRELAHAGEQSAARSVVDPLPIMRLVCETLGHEATRHGVEIHLPSEGAPVACDRAKLYQVLQNLVSNAIRYTDPAKPRRWVRMEAECGDREVAIHVWDNGVGMDETELREAFQPFRRGKQASHCPGMGLGLPIAQRIVQACNGTIRVESEPGQGTRFTVLLPRQAACDDDPSQG
ncbi:MAG: hypothetical protein Kow0092_34600 [Deferrisomatales bacterium]